MIPDRWLRIRVDLPEGAGRGIAADLLVQHGAGSVEEDARGLTTFLPPPPDHEAAVATVTRALRDELPGPLDVSWSWQAHESWSELWKQGLGARRIGRRLLVAPTWIDVAPDEAREVLRIDPGIAFGTAEHATTRGCLAHLDAAVRGGETVLDVGTGSGILAIAAVRLGAVSALGVDVDTMACAAAEDNVRLNGVGDSVRILCRSLEPSTDFGLGAFHVVVANMVMELLVPRLPAMTAALGGDGVLITGGVQHHERDLFTAALTGVGFSPRVEHLEDGWWSARSTRG